MLSPLAPSLVLGLLALPVLQAASADESGTAAASDLARLSAQGWRPIDAVAVQAGDRIVTQREVMEALKAREAEATSQSELEKLLSESLETTVLDRLESQAGEDLQELSPDQLGRVIQSNLEDKRRELGTAGFAASLGESGWEGAVVDQTDGFYRYFWRQAVTGSEGFAGRRSTRDPFIRPGVLLNLYEDQKQELAAPTIVRLQVIDLLPAAAGGAEAARELANELAERARGGEDFGALVLEFAANPGNELGVTEPLALRDIGEETVKRFAESQDVDAVSSPIEMRRPDGTLQAILVMKLLARQAGDPAPPFEEPEVQRRLRLGFRSYRERYRLERARTELRRDAYLWFNPEFLPAPLSQAPPTR